jgi:4-hydroxy-2-oxoheptanedioate aldolase
MRSNQVKEKLKAGQIAVVISAPANTGDMIDFLGPLGFDGFWLEGEHGSVTWSQIGDLTRACDLWGMSSLMRIIDSTPGRITRTLDCGVNGLIIPHINTKAQAEQVVQAARFAPIGQRGIFGGRRSYGQPDFFEKANDEIFLGVMIEEMQAVENLAEILSVDHIDLFFVAPGDLAQTMGLIGQMWHPEVQAVVDDAIKQIIAAGRTAGTVGRPDKLEHYAGLGARFFSLGINEWVQEGAKQYLTKMADLLPTT